MNALFREVEETILAAKDQVPLSAPPSIVTESLPLTSIPVLTPESSSSNMGGGDLVEMQEKLTTLRSGQHETTRPENKNSFNFDKPVSMTLPYLGLDGHPRRITPIPVSLPMLPTRKPLSDLSLNRRVNPAGIGQNCQGDGLKRKN